MFYLIAFGFTESAHSESPKSMTRVTVSVSAGVLVRAHRGCGEMGLTKPLDHIRYGSAMSVTARFRKRDDKEITFIK